MHYLEFMEPLSYKNILLIDDDPDDQEIFLSALESISDSIICTTTSSGVEAMHKLKIKDILPDCIFLDLNMPLMSGEEFLVEIKKNPELKNIPVIIFSTTSHTKTIQLTKQLGAHNFITKPDKYDELVTILKNFFC